MPRHFTFKKGVGILPASSLSLALLAVLIALTSTAMAQKPAPLTSQAIASVAVAPGGNESAGSPQSSATLSDSDSAAKAQAKVLAGYGKLPLSFEPNQGQVDARVKFLSRTGAYSLFLAGDEAVLTLPGSKLDTKDANAQNNSQTLNAAAGRYKPGGVLRMKFRNANPAVKVAGVDQLAGTSNYFMGTDPSKWHTSVPTYAKVKYEGIYSGIDLVYYGNQRQLEYDFIVAPGADPAKIAFDVSGARRIRRNERGDLIFSLGQREIRWRKPVVYQEKNGARRQIAADYSITATNCVGFAVASYDTNLPLYIDPVIYSTYLGGGIYGFNFLGSYVGIAVDSAGNTYVTGPTGSTTFPVTPGAFQTTCCGAFVTKIDPTGSALVYSTYLDGVSFVAAIAIDGMGHAYVTGRAVPGLPTTAGAFQTACAGGSIYCRNAFVTEMNASGSALVYSTYLGGSGAGDTGNSIAVDAAGSAYVAGITSSTDFPVTPGAFQTVCPSICEDAFVAKLNSTGSALVYSSYLGGTPATLGYGIAVDSAGDAYVAGATYSSDFPTTPGAYQTVCTTGLYPPPSCNYSGFVTKFNPSGSALVYSTLLVTSGDAFNSGIAVDTAGNAYVTGAGALVTKLNPSGSGLVYASYLACCGTGIAIDSAGDAWVTGRTNSNEFPTTRGAFQRTCNAGGSSCVYRGAAFLSKLDPSGSVLVYSTYLGGSEGGGSAGYGVAVDPAGNAYVLGTTNSTNFPVTPGAFQPTYGGSSSPYDTSAFVAKFYFAATTTVLSSSLNPSIYGQKVTWTATVTALGPIAPTGKVKFISATGQLFGEATLNSAGTATVAAALENADNYPLTAVYMGDAYNAGSTSAVMNQIITQAASSATITSSSNPSAEGQTATFTATITSPTVRPTGPVTFTAGSTALGTVELTGGKATLATSTLPVGTTTVTVTYDGDSDVGQSSASVVQTVKQ
jgi:hypothetical protein